MTERKISAQKLAAEQAAREKTEAQLSKARKVVAELEAEVTALKADKKFVRRPSAAAPKKDFIAENKKRLAKLSERKLSDRTNTNSPSRATTKNAPAVGQSTDVKDRLAAKRARLAALKQEKVAGAAAQKKTHL